MKYLILFVLLFGCNAKTEEKKSEYYFNKQEKVTLNSYRIENKEVICYTRYSGGLSCKWKEK